MPYPGLGFPQAFQEWPHVGRQWPVYNVESDQADGMLSWWPVIASGDANYVQEIVTGQRAIPNDLTHCYYRPDWFGPAFYFDGTKPGGRLDVGGPNSRFEVQAHAFAFWCRSNVTVAHGVSRILANTGPTGYPDGYVWSLRGQAGLTYVAFAYRDAGGIQGWYLSNLTITGYQDKWMHIICAWKSGTMYAWKDGLSLGTTATTAGPITHSASPLFFGYQANNQNWNGYMLGIRLLDHVPIDSEARQMYDQATRWELYQIPSRLWRLGAIAPPPPTIIPVAMHYYRSMRL